MYQQNYSCTKCNSVAQINVPIAAMCNDKLLNVWYSGIYRNAPQYTDNQLITWTSFIKPLITYCKIAISAYCLLWMFLYKTLIIN